MNLGELLSEVRSQLDDVFEVDDSDALWKDTELTFYINEAQREAAIRTDCLADSATASVCQIDIVADTDNYVISPLILRVKALKLVSNNCVLEKLDVSDIIWHCTAKREGLPTAYTLGKDTGKLWFDSVPEEDDTANLVVTRLPLVDLSDNADVPEIPVSHHLKMLEWVKYLAYSKRDSEMYDPVAREQAEQNFFNYFGNAFDIQEQERRLKGGEMVWEHPVWGDNYYVDSTACFW
jgi:hypothetical protein